jgi:hypothetical protein
MKDDEFIAHMRARINMAYADQIGTESWERKMVLAIIDRLQGEIAQLKSLLACGKESRND